jgi:putative endonuclease
VQPPAWERALDTHSLGRRFEDAAAAWLEARGWRLVERNVRFQRREIDLIARRAGVLAFVEVKGRRGTRYGRPEEAVTVHKRREIETVARWWIARHGEPELAYRFDVVAVDQRADGALVIDHLEDAWRP